MQLKKVRNVRLLLLFHQWHFVHFLYFWKFFAFSLLHLERDNICQSMSSPSSLCLSSITSNVSYWDWVTRVMISASFVTCVSDVKTSSSVSTYPSTVKSTSADLHLSWKSLNYASTNLKGSSSSDWFCT